ncbi:paxillin [Clonorchis sinensis]|nr:paxillin [Clonorchis sinensis]
MMSDLSNELAQQGAITAPKGFCFACKKPIVGMLISAMDKYWHPDHFTCTNCGVGLVRANFYERDSQPYCTDCHARIFSPKCANCGEAILEKCIVALGRTWHPEHFFCNGCYRGFSGQVTVHEHENRVYCPACYLERFGTRCSGCNRTITDSYITALDVPWHRACFVCQDCGKPLSGSNFHEVDGYPFCEAHFYQRRGLLCYACSKPITGRCVNALGRRYHPEHFKCAYCLQTLQTGTFKEHSSKPYCHQCFAQLFG